MTVNCPARYEHEHQDVGVARRIKAKVYIRLKEVGKYGKWALLESEDETS